MLTTQKVEHQIQGGLGLPVGMNLISAQTQYVSSPHEAFGHRAKPESVEVFLLLWATET